MADLRNLAPYRQDYDPVKEYYQVMYQPSKAIQARELNNSQAIVQEQINRFGQNIFQDGTLVLGGGISTIMNQDVVTVNLTLGSVYTDISNRDELFVRSNTSGLRARVIKTFDVENTDPVTLFVEYDNSGTEGQTRTFSDSEFVVFSAMVGGSEQDIATATIITTDEGTWCRALESVYFIDGLFVNNAEQDYIISKYTTDPTRRIGFEVVRDIVTEAEDNTLFSNAAGTINENGAGAHRYRIDLRLTGLNEGQAEQPDTPFMEIIRLENGIVTRKIDQTQYSILGDTLAQRTFEESGDYTVTPFSCLIREHLNDGTNGGYLTAQNGGLESKFVVDVNQGVGFVKGYRVSNPSIEHVVVDKARDTDSANNTVVAATYGNYIIVNNLFGMPDLNIGNTFNLHDAIITGGADTGNVIGTCRVRSAQRHSDTEIRLYIFDVQMNTGNTFSQVNGIRYTDASNLFGGGVVGSNINESANNRLVFGLANTSIRSLKANGIDTSYVVIRDFTPTTNSSGIATITVGSNELFSTLNNFEYLIAVRGASEGEVIDVSGKLSLSGTPVGRTLNINLGVGFESKELTVIAPVLKQQALERTKTDTLEVEFLTLTNESVKALEHADVRRIASIVDTNNGTVVTDSFELDTGQRDSFYTNGSIRVRGGRPVSGSYQVTYNYFEHGTGDYFSVDSYDVSYEDIPTYTASDGEILQLTDSFDFRPVRTASGFTDVDVIRPNDTIRADAEYYLPRIDSVYVSSDGDFGVVKGISSLTPSEPSAPNNSMVIATLEIPAYTKSASDVVKVDIDNRRYTMRDIGRLDTRISNLEYYTSLNTLETTVNNVDVIDPATGNSRFKNGIAADDFSDYILSDINSAEYRATVDFQNLLVVPEWAGNAVDMNFTSGTSHRIQSDVAMIDYTEQASVVQPYATRTSNINPYAVFTWNGNVVLDPAVDFWRDVKFLPPIIQNRTINNRGGVVEEGVSRVLTSSSRTLVGDRDYDVRNTFSVIQTELTSNVQTSTTTNVVNTEIIPFMREIDINFVAKGLKPQTRLYPFFADTFVGPHCRPNTGSFGDNITTDVSGNVSGVFRVPVTDSDKFRTGRNTFRLSDSNTNSFLATEVSTSAEAEHDSSGELSVSQNTVNSITTLGLRQTESVQTTIRRVQDPIAQSFQVGTIGGEFLSSVDVYFKTKSANIPVTLALRYVDTGLPTNIDLPLGTVTLNPNQVNISDDASVATKFTFDAPVYLERNRTIAIVMLADTIEYEVYIAQLGEARINGDGAVSKQPNLGSFFTSQNQETWTPEQNRDLMFTVNRAVFNSNSAVIEYDCGENMIAPFEFFNPIDTTNASSTVSMHVRSHGLKVGDTITASGCVGGNGINAEALNKVHTVTAVTDIDVFTVDLGVNANADGSIGGGNCRLIGNLLADSFSSSVNTIVVEGTNIVWEYRLNNQGSRVLSDYSSFDANTIVNLVNTGVITGPNDLKIRATLNSSRNTLSPMIDNRGFISVLTSGRVSADENNPKFSWVSKDIIFDNPCTTARIWVGANLAGDTDMKLYYKPFYSADDDITEVDWTELSPVNAIINSDLPVEYVYNLESIGSFVGYKIRIDLLTDEPIYRPSLNDFRTVGLA